MALNLTKPSMRSIESSLYLQRLLRLTGRSDWLDSPKLAVEAIEHIVASLEGSASTSHESIDFTNWTAVGEFLADQKRHFSLAISIADIFDLADTESLGHKQSRFAELSLDIALRAAWQQEAIKKLCRGLPEPGELVPGLFILGLGKLGGQDLNYSSDIDLIAFFNPHLLPVHPMQGTGDVCSRVLKSVTKLLSGSDGGELIWRVDWRLRPESSATQISMSIEAAQDYYFFRALPWHRLALMKARVVAGDIDQGKQFLHDIEPFIWRQNLDFRAIEELAYLKDRIDLEHPKLLVQGKRDNSISTQPEGFNLKLGTGGIREIEFIANGLQLIWGGKRSVLRTGHTLSALAELSSQGLIDSEKVSFLKQDYVWLRRLENRLQMLGNEQTHNIPTNEQALTNFQSICGITHWQEFSEELITRRTRVHKVFDDLFRPEDQDSNSEVVTSFELEALPQKTQDILQDWSEGFRQYGVSESQASRTKGLYQSLLDEISCSSVPVEMAVDQIHQFFRRLPPGGQYISLLQSSPKLLSGLVMPLIYSPAMQTLLAQSPHIIDALLQQDRAGCSPLDWQFDSSWILQNPDYDVRLERMRRLVNEELYQFYLCFLQGYLDPLQFQNRLTELALFSLETGLQVVSDEIGRAAEISIFGMGKLGMSRMSPMSDLDITYVYSDQEPMDQATRFVNRLQTALSTKMKEGIVYEMDTRLRPSGRSGAPTVSLTSFDYYQNERAKTWEHIALVSGRHVLGDAKTGAAVDQVRRNILSRPRDPQQFSMDAIKMLERIREQRITAVSEEQINTKLRPGGLMETEYLIACLCIKLAQQYPQLLDLSYPDMVDRIAELSGMAELAEHLQFWRVLQIWERLLGLGKRLLTDIPESFSDLICKQLGVSSIMEIATKSKAISEAILKSIESELPTAAISAAEIELWKEEPIVWLS